MRLFILFSLLIFISCRQPTGIRKPISLKDSVAKKHLALIDSLDYYDTLDEDYRMLRAYVNNDSNYFIEMSERIRAYEEDRKENPRLDTCVHLPKLSNLNVDEAYRFYHNQSFCYYGQRITIARTGDSVWLQYVEYGATDVDRKVEYTTPDGIRVVGPGCKIENEFEKQLSLKDWEKLEQLIHDADYWGLKEANQETCTDGSRWTIEAFTKKGRYYDNGKKVHRVFRHCSIRKTFFELGAYFLKLSGVKTMCGDFF